jgi:hypothetical protein
MPLVVIPAVSGLLWGLLGAWLTQKIFGPYVWIAAPTGILIGLLIYQLSRRFYSGPAWQLVPVAIVTTIMAVGLFGIVVGIVDATSGSGNRMIWKTVVQSANACVAGLLFLPAYWPLFLVAWGNHWLIRKFAYKN